jgi:hypothetical protein
MLTTSGFTRRGLIAAAVLAGLLALRLPSLAEPAGADQSLYAYAGIRLLAGDAPYAGAWDQKPPGVHAIYALLWRLWPDEAVVGAADLAAAACCALLLVVLGRQWRVPRGGWIAAGAFLLLSHPSLQRLSGVFVRGQCETFIAVLVTLAFVWTAPAMRRVSTAAAAGAALGLAIWIKYNAVAYVLPVAGCLWFAPSLVGVPIDRAVRRQRLIAGAASLLLVGAAGLLYLWARGALLDLRLATIDYNLHYSGETYHGLRSVITHTVGLPFVRARYDVLWFLGGAGTVLAVTTRRARMAGVLAAAWIGAAVLSIAINGARDLPQYFVQAAPAMGWAAGVGFAAAFSSDSRTRRLVAALIVLAACWRVGTDRPGAAGFRFAGLPGLAANIRFDVNYLRGRIDRTTYLSHFGGQRDRDKFAALDVEQLASLVERTTRPDDTILVFGFSPGVYVKSGRQSASRFFWSLPVVTGFEAGRPGYGASGLLEDLQRARPALVALQKQDWAPDSETFFLAQPALAAWLHDHYVPDTGQRMFAIWRRR